MRRIDWEAIFVLGGAAVALLAPLSFVAWALYVSSGHPDVAVEAAERQFGDTYEGASFKAMPHTLRCGPSGEGWYAVEATQGQDKAVICCFVSVGTAETCEVAQ